MMRSRVACASGVVLDHVYTGKALHHFCEDLHEGQAEDRPPSDATCAAPAGAAGVAPTAKAVSVSQLDDWLHRGADPIV